MLRYCPSPFQVLQQNTIDGVFINKRNLFLNLEARKSKIKAPECSHSSEGSFPVSLIPSLSPHSRSNKPALWGLNLKGYLFPGDLII